VKQKRHVEDEERARRIKGRRSRSWRRRRMMMMRRRRRRLRGQGGRLCTSERSSMQYHQMNFEFSFCFISAVFFVRGLIRGRCTLR
jgi:hypothetical protein